MQLKTIGDVQIYVNRHIETLGFPPTAIGLQYEDYINILMEMGASPFGARCTNLQAAIGGIRVVRL